MGMQLFQPRHQPTGNNARYVHRRQRYQHLRAAHGGRCLALATRHRSLRGTATFSIDDMALNADTLFLIIRCQSPHLSFGGGHFTRYIVALSLVDGSQRWLLANSNMTILGTTVDALLLALPTTIPYPVNGHTQYNGQILALNSANGFIKWQIADSGLAMTPLGILAGQPDGTLAMLNANTGALIWHSS